MLSFPNAKINIGLYVVERRPDGYHNLETVFMPIPLRDVLEVKLLEKSDKPYEMQTTGIKIEGDNADNLVLRVYRSMKEEFDLPPVSIYLCKHIPTGAGLGGGSSDAAFMMRTLNSMFTLKLSEDEMERRLSSFGVDCPFFVRNQPVFATGIGDQFSPIPLDLKGWTLLLIKPKGSVSTAAAYRGVTPRPAPCDLRQVLLQPVEEWREQVSNDFEPSVFPQLPEVAAIKATLYDMGAVYASMSGSGSSVFGLLRHPFENAERIFPDCFCFQKEFSTLEPEPIRN